MRSLSPGGNEMTKNKIVAPIVALLLGGVFLSYVPGNNYNQGYYYDREEHLKIPYLDRYRDEDIHERARRRGNWGFRQNYRYDRKSFYSGETQGEAYDREHPDGSGGIGIDRDNEYVQMRQFYLDQERKYKEANHRQPDRGQYTPDRGRYNQDRGQYNVNR